MASKCAGQILVFLLLASSVHVVTNANIDSSSHVSVNSNSSMTGNIKVNTSGYGDVNVKVNGKQIELDENGKFNDDVNGVNVDVSSDAMIDEAPSPSPSPSPSEQLIIDIQKLFDKIRSFFLNLA